MQVQAIQTDQLLFSELVRHTGIAEYGIRWNDLLAGSAEIPAEGARFDISFAGTLTGPDIEGTIEGTDFLVVRADGRFLLDIRANITTADGHNIALREDGIMIPDPDGGPNAELRLNMQFTTAAPRYRWLNQLQAWGRGMVYGERGEVEVTAFVS